MSESLFDPLWHRVATLCPRLKEAVRIHPHRYRGQQSYVLEDREAARHQRLNPAGWRLATLFDGKRSVHEVWEAVSEAMGDDAPSQSECMRLLSELHGAGLLSCATTPDVDALFKRYRKSRRNDRRRRLASPFAVRVPIADPDPLLARLAPFGRVLFSLPGFLVWLTLVACGVLLAVDQWEALSAHATQRALAPGNLLLIAVCYPFVKLLHELGHGLATRRWGGEVHQFGVMLLLLMPMPYVDASAAGVFADKYRRITVSAAGILIESGLAAIAVLLWFQLEPGVPRDLAFNIALLGGVSTVVFNANPLLKFDGYYMLQDWLEIPNLGSRSQAQLIGLLKRHVCGLREAALPATTRGEAAWLSAYALASGIYRITLMAGLSLMLAAQYALAGALLGLWGFVSYILLPLFKALRYLAHGSELAARRSRALLVCTGLATLLALGVFRMPLPFATAAEGVVWAPPGTELRARADGFVTEVLVEDGAELVEGEAVALTRDALLPAQVAVLDARLAELRLSRRAAWGKAVAEAAMVDDSIAALGAELEDAREQVRRLDVVSPAPGRLLALPDALVPGRFVQRGELLGYVHGAAAPTVRVIVEQGAADLVQRETRAVEVLSPQAPGRPMKARVLRRVPAASSTLPSAALGDAAGGQATIDPLDANGRASTRSHYEYELALGGSDTLSHLGSRVRVRFLHPPRTLATQAWRQLRGLFLKGLGA